MQAIAPEQLAQPLAVLGKAGTQFQTQAGEVMKYIQDHRGELSRDVLVRLPRYPRSMLHHDASWVAEPDQFRCLFTERRLTLSVGSAHRQRQAHASRARLH